MSVPSEFMRAARRAVGPDSIRIARAELDAFATDGLPTLRHPPEVVFLPETKEEVVRLVRLLAHYDVPFVPRGAGTGLSGGALAVGAPVLIVLTRLNRILEVDPDNRLAVVEPGVVNARLSEATRSHGLHYAPDPSSQTACTIGGNVAENAGGPHCLKYGVTLNHILAAEVLLPDGDLLRLGSPSGDSGGLDLLAAFIGSEGMFGIATEITVRLTPTPKSVRTLLADFGSIERAGEAVSRVIASGVVPAALEMMDQNCVRAVEASIYAAGYPTDAAAVLLVELDGMDSEVVEHEAGLVISMLEDAGARAVQSASTEGERNRLWQGRKKAFGALGRISPDLVVQDAVVPRTKLPQVLREISQIGARYRVTVSNVFHAGDGNLHPNLNFDRTDPDQFERVRLASREIMEVCIAAGGTISGEHGVGLDKVGYMSKLFDRDSLSAMSALRAVFDPAGLANPGKVLPTHECREWRAASRAVAENSSPAVTT